MAGALSRGATPHVLTFASSAVRILYGARLRTADALAPVVLLVLLGVGVTQGLRRLETRFNRWR